MITIAKKQEEKLSLVYLSLISAKKNLLQVIEIISEIKNVALDIYGPVKDEGYWKKCKEAMQNTERIKYKGDVIPSLVPETFSRYNASVLLTKGENFGHAMYESLAAGRPVITSYFTPWKDLWEKKAGSNVDISNTAEIKKALNKFAAMDQPAFNEYYQGAHALAVEYYSTGFDLNDYRKLFELN